MSWEVGNSDTSARAGGDDNLELCDECGYETPHEVRIEIRTESTKRDNAEYSREPYRIATCLTCGEESAVRMNYVR
jgi:predicted RNA-binding Zn-ribbon protein involved in translation (DUF1610 family)